MKKNYFKSLAQVAMLLCVPLFIASCDELGTEDNPTPSYISMKTDAVTIMKGDTYTRTALAASSAVIEYKSEDEAIATVNATTGEVTGKADGTTNIVAVATGYSTGGKKIYLTEEVKYKLTVQDPVGMIAYDFGEAGVPNLVYAGTALNVADIAIAPQKNNGALTFTYTLEEVVDVTASPWTTSAVGTGTITKAGVYKVIAEWATKKPYVTFTAPADTASYYVKVVDAVAFARWDATEKALKNDTILKSDLKGTISADKDGGTLAAGTYFVSADVTFSSAVKLTGDVNLIIADGKTLTITGSIDDDTPATPHKLNILRQVGTNVVGIGGPSTSDFFKNLAEVNFHGEAFNVTLLSSGTGCGGFAEVGAVNIYGPSVTCANNGTAGYGAKMKDAGTITLYAGSFLAGSSGAEEYSKAVIGKVKMMIANKKFVESDDIGAADEDWTAVPETGVPTKKFVKVL